MKRLLVFLAVAGCVLFTAATRAEEMQHGHMKGNHMKHGGMSHEMMLERCKQEMVDMKMPPTTTKEQNDQMMNQCMERMRQGQHEIKGGKK